MLRCKYEVSTLLDILHNSRPSPEEIIGRSKTLAPVPMPALQSRPGGIIGIRILLVNAFIIL